MLIEEKQKHTIVILCISIGFFSNDLLVNQTFKCLFLLVFYIF